MNFSPFLLFLVFGIGLCGTLPTDQSATFTTPETIPERLAAIRAGMAAGEADYLRAREELIGEADARMAAPLYAVTQKLRTPPSGDKHDYYSIAPYWWPDPAREDGLPWIRRDGEVNPAYKNKETDHQGFATAIGNIETLAQAAYFTDNRRYADRAVEQLTTLFLDPATRMNPHLQYAQGVPGRSTGRCFGIIETVKLRNVVSALELLKAGGFLPATTETGMRAWLSDYADWLQNSELGREEAGRHNNHAIWYDAQLVSYLRYLGREADARRILLRVPEHRIATQVAVDGSQPHELERTKSISYSTMNLRGFTILAWYGEQLGIDIWDFTSPDGRSLPAAYAFLQPYAFGGKSWDHQQLGDAEAAWDGTRKLFRQAAVLMEEPGLCRTVAADRDRDLQDLYYRCE